MTANTAPPLDAGASLDTRHTLMRLLDRCQSFLPEYGAGLSTHLPMALQALHALGAPPTRLEALFALHAPKLSPRSAAGAPPAHPQPWPVLRGQFEQFEALAAMFDAALRAEGLGPVLRRTLPRLLPGVATAAFHGLIRTAHGVAGGHAGELSTGLAYWAAHFAPLITTHPGAAFDEENAPPGQPELDLPAWLAAVLALPGPADANGWLIMSRMKAWAQQPGFAELAPRLRIEPDTLDALAHVAAKLYAASGDFTTLHLVTACQALRELTPWVGDNKKALRWFSMAAAAALRASRSPVSIDQIAALPSGAISPEQSPNPLPWPAIVQRAINSTDEHVIKLVRACQAHEAATADAVFRSAASRAVQQV